MARGDLRIDVQPSYTRRFIRPATFDRLFKEALREAAADAELIFGAYAGRRLGKSTEPRSGRLVRGIKTVTAGMSILIITEAKNPKTGYDYVGVTRFGHRGMIVPRPGREAASVLATGSRRASGRNAALRFVIGGRVVYRRSTKGFHPVTDWAAEALPEIQRSTDQIMGKLARKIEVSGG